MPIYRVQGPDGKIYRVEGPEGATAEQLGAALQGQRPAAQRPPIMEDTRSALQRGLRGVLKPFAETGIGIRRGVRGLFGGDSSLSPEEQRTLDYLTKGAGIAGAEVGEDLGTAGVVGEFAGNVGMFAAPGGAIMRGASLTPRAALAADIALNAGLSGTQSYGRDDSFSEGAAWGAGGSLAGAGLARGAQALRPQWREGAKELIDQGVPLTPGQAANSGFQALENAAANIPVVGTPIRRLQREAVGGWNRTVLRDVVPDPAGITAGGNEGFEQATRQFSKAYDDLFSRELPTGQIREALTEYAENVSRLSPGVRNTMREVADEFGGDTIDGKILEKLDDQLRDMAVAARRAGDSADAEALQVARNAIRSSVPDDFNTAWSALDDKFRQFATARRAATYQGAARNRGVFTPAELLRASAAQDKSAGKRAFAQGRGALQQRALDAEEILQVPTRGLAEQLSAPIGVGALLVEPMTVATAYGASRTLINEPARKLIVNKIMRKQPLTPEEIQKALQMGLIGGGAAGATAE